MRVQERENGGGGGDWNLENILQHAAIQHGVEHTATHRNAPCNSFGVLFLAFPQRTATHCNTPQHTATHCNSCNRLQHAARKPLTLLPPTAIHCNTTNPLQHTATHYNAPCCNFGVLVFARIQRSGGPDGFSVARQDS